MAAVTAPMTAARLASVVVRGSGPYQARTVGSKAVWIAAIAAACSGVGVRTSPSITRREPSSQILSPLSSANRPNRYVAPSSFHDPSAATVAPGGAILAGG